MKKFAMVLLVALICVPAFARISGRNYGNPKLVLSCDATIGEDGFRFSTVGIQVETPVYGFKLSLNSNDTPLCFLVECGFVLPFDGDMSKGGFVMSAKAGIFLLSGYDIPAVGVNAGLASRFTFVDSELKAAFGVVGELEANMAGTIIHGEDMNMFICPSFTFNVKYMFLDTTGTDRFSIGLDAGAIWQVL